MSEGITSEQAAAEKTYSAAKRMLRALDAQEDLIAFNEMLMPDPSSPDDVSATLYDAQLHHKALAACLEEVVKGKVRRLIITMPPRHGKTQLVSRSLPAFAVGQQPRKSIIVGTYNGEYAEDIGRDVRTIIKSAAYQQIFPNTTLRAGSAASDRLQTDAGGILAFVGRGKATTGRGADILILDDPIKDAQEADSPAIREQTWKWFTKVLMTRRASQTAPIVITLTRWHEDDIVGRLTDPLNPCFSPEFAYGWKIFNLPAIAEEDDPIGRPVGEPLWPSKFGIEFLQQSKQLDPRGFSALYQQKPTPEDGEFFTREMFQVYRPEQLPAKETLRIYAASDHAVGIKQMNDRTAMVIVGIDPSDGIWVLDAFWKRVKTDLQVEAMLALAKEHKPVTWFGETGQISKSIGPFLKKSMDELKLWFYINEITPTADKQTRAQSIRGRMAQGKVRWPAGAAWFEDVRSEFMKFPYGKHDDFVDAMALIGLGLAKQFHGKAIKDAANEPKVGTWGWLKKASKLEGKAKRNRMAMGGM